MMDPENLHLLISEEIYVIDEHSAKKEEIETQNELPPTGEEGETKSGHTEVTPSIPVVVKEITKKVVPVAIFHESTNESDLELLQKIIDACKLSPEQYQVFASGFNKEVRFEKALVFVANAKIFYESVPYKDGQIICSKPLLEIADNQQEKAKLWGVLKKFL